MKNSLCLQATTLRAIELLTRIRDDVFSSIDELF